MPSHNSKYYIKSVKTNPVKSQKITSLFQRKNSLETTKNQDEPPEKVPREEPVVETPPEIHIETNDTSESAPPPVSTIVTSDDEKEMKFARCLMKWELTRSSSKSIDLWQRNVSSYEQIFPEFYYNTLEKGWYCKICTSFSVNVAPNRAFVTKAGIFGDHPSRRTQQHLNSSTHLKCTKNKQAFDKLSKRNSNVWKLLQESSLSQSIKQVSTNRFIIKSFSYHTFNDKKKLGPYT